MKKSFILVLLFALSSNIYSQKFDIPRFQEEMSKMENLARKNVKEIIKKRKNENFHFLIVPFIYPPKGHIYDATAYTDSLLKSGGIITGEFPNKSFVEFFLYNDRREFVCSGSLGSKGTNFYCKNLGYREDEFLFNAIIALNPDSVFVADFISEYYYVFSKDKIYKLKDLIFTPPIVTLLYTSPK